MLKKVTLTAVFRGKQLVKKGTDDEKEIDKTAIKTTEHGDTWLSTFKTQGTEGFVEGQEVELSITQNGQYFNFELPSETDMRLAKLEAVVFPTEAVSAPAETTTTPPPGGEEDVPF